MRGFRITLVAAASLAAALLLAGAGALGSTPAAAETWVVSGGSLFGGTVKSIAVSGDTAYLGGNFSYLGPPTGSTAAFNTSTSAMVSPWPEITGSVYAIAPDGSGGWFVGGQFDSIGTAHYDNLVHILANGTIDPAWDAGTNGIVFSLVVNAAGTIVYAGGAFTEANGTARSRLAAFNAGTGALLSFNPGVSGAGGFVWTMAIASFSGDLYLGGSFATVGGQTRNNLAAVSTAGNTTLWNPNVNGTVRALAIETSGTFYAGGEFSTVNIGGITQATRAGLAAFNTAGIVDNDWSPSQNGRVESLAVFGSGALAKIYVGGTFSTLGGQTRRGLAKVAENGIVDASWNPDLFLPATVSRITLSSNGQTVYAGGFFQVVGTTSRDNVVSLSAANAAINSFNPIVGGAVYALALNADDSRLAAGGQFRSAGPELVRRNNLAAIDLDTGEATDWAPYANNTVATLAVAGSVVYAGGRFEIAADDGAGTNFGSRPCLAAFDAATAELLDWDPELDPTPLNTPCVNTIAVSGSTVYVGGNFSLLFDANPAPPGPQLLVRNGIAAFDDALTGDGSGFVRRDWDPNANAAVNAIVVSGSAVYVGGDFTSIGGPARNHLAALDAASGVATDWHPNLNNSVEALAVTSSTVYAGGTFTQVNNGNVDRSGAAAFGTGGVGELGALADTATDWDPNVQRLDGSGNLEPGTVNALATSGSVVYLGGDFDSVGDDSAEEGAAVAVDASGGAALSSWQPEPNDTVDAIALAQAGVLVGGAFTAVGYPRPRADFEPDEANAKARGGFAAFLGLPEPPGNVTAGAGNGSATVSFTASPFTGGAAVTYTVTSSPGNITASGSGTTIPVPGLTNGQQYTFTVTATNSVGVSQPSAPSNAVTPGVGPSAPGAPTNVSATPGNGQATVTFDAPASNGAPIIEYTVVSSPGGHSQTQTGTSITVSGLTNGTSYTFTVTARNSVGTGPPSAPSNAVTPRTVPGAPSVVSATPGNSQVTVAFTAPANGGSPITEYTVTSSPGDISETDTTSPITVTGLTNGTSYTFTVTAKNAAGPGPASTPSSPVTPRTVPGAPDNVSAVPGNGQATVSFDAPFTGGAAITKYTVTTSGGGPSVESATSPIVVTGLTNGVSYTFTVTATNEAGTGPASSPSNAVVPGSTPTAPGAPTGVTASAGDRRAVVSFVPPALDGGTAITSYTVTASPGGQTASGSESPILVEGLANGTSYTFTVTATNGAGTGPPSSPSAPVVPAVPGRPAAPPAPPSAQPRPDVPDAPPQTTPRRPAPPQ